MLRNIYKILERFQLKTAPKFFKNFWSLGDLQKQRHFIGFSMTTVVPRCKYVREESNQRPNNAF